MPSQQADSIPRILKYLKSRNELRTKGKTIKKATPVAQASIAQNTCDETAPDARNEDTTFPSKYYTPRPSLKSFIVGEVRRVSNNSRHPDLFRSKHGEVDHEISTAAKSDVGPQTHHDQTSSLLAPCPGPSSPEVLDAGLSLKNANTGDSRPVVNNVSAAPHPRLRPAFKLLLGRQDPISPYFTRRYFRFTDVAASHSTSDASNESLHHISELDPQAFEMYKIYFRTGTIALRYPDNVDEPHLWMACWPLMNAHLLGCIIEEPGFADRVMDALVERIGPGACPDVETIAHLFDDNREAIPNALKQFVVDRFIDAPEADRQCLNSFRMPASFSQVALQTTLQRLERKPDVAVQSGCEYHVHSTVEACYKTKLNPVNALREKKLAEAREVSAKDAKAAMANVVQNGVKSVDWERRRADANQALREKTGRTWVGFKRLHGGLSVENADAVKQDLGKLKGGTFDNHTSDRARVQGSAALINGTKATFDLTRTPNNSPIFQGSNLERSPAATPILVMKSNSEMPGSEMTAPYSDHLHVFAAELPGSTVNGCPHSMEAEVIKNRERGVSCPGAYPESDLGV